MKNIDEKKKSKRNVTGDKAVNDNPSKNKHSRVKDNSFNFIGVLHSTFESIGGKEALTKWAENNQKDFFNLLIKTVPKEIDVDMNINKISAADLVEDDEN